MIDAPRISRVRHELRRRRLDVARVEDIAPGMRRVVLTGNELAGFTSLGFDDHVKLFFDAAGGGSEPPMRDFTPRRYDTRLGELWIDFFLHDAGPAAEWATSVKPGDALNLGGPRGSMVIDPEGIDLHLLVGDETAYPAICRRLEELPAGAHARVVLETGAEASWPLPPTRARVEATHVVRESDDAPPARDLIDALRSLDFATAGTHAWVALESHAARAVRTYLRTERGFTKEWIKAAAYWRRGAVGTHEKLEDD